MAPEPAPPITLRTPGLFYARAEVFNKAELMPLREKNHCLQGPNEHVSFGPIHAPASVAQSG